MASVIAGSVQARIELKRPFCQLAKIISSHYSHGRGVYFAIFLNIQVPLAHAFKSML